MNNELPDINCQRVPATWLMYDPISGHEETIDNDGTLESFFRREYLYGRGWLMDYSVYVELESEDNDNGQ